jgi:hypothetical protein
MKKLSNVTEILSRQELKQIHGGSGGDEIIAGNSYCYCENGQSVNVPDCGWCHLVCNIRGGYKKVCLTFD